MVFKNKFFFEITLLLVMFSFITCNQAKSNNLRLLLGLAIFSNTTQSKAKSYIVSTLAGSGQQGSIDGSGIAATFLFPFGICVDSKGVVYVADTYNNKIRKITPDGNVTTLAGSGVGSAIDGVGTLASFNRPYSLTIGKDENIYVADTNNHKIRKISSNGTVATFAGSGLSGFLDGTGTAATFDTPYGITTDINGNVLVLEIFNRKIRKISVSGVVTTFAGSGASGYTDGNGNLASFNNPNGIIYGNDGTIYVSDFGNGKIRKISSDGLVSTLSNTIGYIGASGISMDSNMNLYITEGVGNITRILKITSEGKVSHFAGSGKQGSENGVRFSSSFNEPNGIAVDSNGTIYIADTNNHQIRKITLQ